jgi:ribosomal protein S8
MLKSIKHILAIILIAQKKKLSYINITFSKYLQKLLDLLWQSGIVYGYLINKTYLKYIVFIKRSISSYLPSLSTCKLVQNKKEKVQEKLNSQKSSIFFVCNDRGISILFNQLTSLGGVLFYQL